MDDIDAAAIGRKGKILETGRRVALLGGTTTLADCLTILRYLVDPRQLVHGSMIEQYEEAFAAKLGVRYAYSFCAGRVGLYGILQALNIGPGDEILLQVPTHIVVANAVRYTGARPVYVDCRLDNYNMDLEQAERLVTPKTKAIILQHTFGIPVDMDAALALARRHRLELIEDCVHALGATYGGRLVGSFGRASFFSTEETKIISSTMGGVVTTDDHELAAKIRTFQKACAWPSASLTARYLLKLLAYYVLTEPHFHRFARAIYELVGRRQPLPGPTTPEELRGLKPTGFVQRLSNAQAAVALQQLQRLESNVGHRRMCAQTYSALFSKSGFQAPQVPHGAKPSYVRYPVWVKDRAKTIRTASSHVVMGTWFTSVLEEAVSPAYGDYCMGSCPNAEAVAKHLINLPTHGRVSLQDIEAIVSDVVRADGRKLDPAAISASNSRDELDDNLSRANGPCADLGTDELNGVR